MWSHILNMVGKLPPGHSGAGAGFFIGVIITFFFMLVAGIVILLLVNYCRSKRIECAIGRLEKTLEEHVGKDKE